MKPYDTIWLDMDGVLVDFIAGAVNRLGAAEDIDTTGNDAWQRLGCDTPEFWAKVENAGADFWADLPAFDTHTALVSWARSNANLVGICTAPPRLSTPAGRKFCRLGKIEWLHRHGLDDASVMFTRDKHLLANPRALLVDDLPGNCLNWAAHGGQALAFPRAWNANRQDLAYFDTRQLF